MYWLVFCCYPCWLVNINLTVLYQAKLWSEIWNEVVCVFVCVCVCEDFSVEGSLLNVGVAMRGAYNKKAQNF